MAKPLKRPPDQLRKAIRRFMERRGLAVTSWCREAGISESTLRNFLNAKDAPRTMQHASLDALAKAAHASVGILTGDVPDPLDSGSGHVDTRESQLSEDEMRNLQLMVRLLREIRDLQEQQLALMTRLLASIQSPAPSPR